MKELKVSYFVVFLREVGMLQQIYLVLTGIVVVITFVLGILFLAIHIPHEEVFHNYRLCRKLLAFAYFIMGGLNLVELLMNAEAGDPFIIRYITLIISSFQAFLFTYALITLINNKYLTTKRLFKEVVPIAILTIFCSIALSVHLPAPALHIIFYLGIAYYIFQLINYTLIFNHQYILYQKKINNYFSEKETLRLRWTRFSFYTALFIGIIALTSVFLTSPLTAVFFILIFALFYLYFSIKYLNYIYVFNIIEPIIHTESELKSEFVRLSNDDISNSVEQWVRNKGYIKTGITLIELASQLKTNRTYLSNYINTQKGMNFNAWINWLRVEEAKKLMKERPKIPITEISEQLGYSEQSNFGRYFLKYTGKTPGSWRKEAVK